MAAPAYAAPAIYMNTGTPSACVLTPTTATLLTLDTAGNANAVGTLSGPCVGSTPIPPDPGVCVPGPSGDLGTFGYSRMCAGNVRSLNANMRPKWDNTYAGVMSGPWPGNTGQFGWGLQITVNQSGFGSFRFNTGATPAGVSFASNTSYGNAGTVNVSTVPGDTFGGTALCTGRQQAQISSKPGTMGTCKLQPNTDYYLNVSMADPFAPHGSMCATPTCVTGWTVYSYAN
jgi:hypothetical protein